MDDVDRRLLNVIQKAVPLVERPFQAIAVQAGLDERQVIERISALRSGARPIIRQISAIFDTAALGYASTLVAARVDPDRIEAAAEAVNLHPGVTHNYQRNHDYNLWYTLAVGPDSRLGLARTVELLHERSGALATRMLPTLKLYKIGVSFDMTGESDPAAQTGVGGFGAADRARAMAHSISDAEKSIIRVLQQDLPAMPRPFDAWATQAGMSTRELLDAASAMLQRGWMRRFSAVLHHRQAGISANAMGVWVVPPDRADAFGATAAGFAAVSHCYLRPTYPDWPYSIFTMVHGRSHAECEATLGAIAAATGISEYRALYSSRQFKKVRLRYFVGDIEEWETDALGRQ